MNTRLSPHTSDQRSAREVEERVVLTTVEAAKLLRIASSTLRDLASKGQVPHIRLGSRVLFYRSDLLNLPRAVSFEPPTVLEGPSDSSPTLSPAVDRGRPRPRRSNRITPNQPPDRTRESIVTPNERPIGRPATGPHLPISATQRRSSAETTWVKEPETERWHIRKSPGRTWCRLVSTGWLSRKRHGGRPCVLCDVIRNLGRLDSLRPGDPQPILAGGFIGTHDWRARNPKLVQAIEEALRRK